MAETAIKEVSSAVYENISIGRICNAHQPRNPILPVFSDHPSPVPTTFELRPGAPKPTVPSENLSLLGRAQAPDRDNFVIFRGEAGASCVWNAPELALASGPRIELANDK